MLRFSASGAQLASGSQDTDVIVWDVVAQAGLFRLRGHHGQVRTYSAEQRFDPMQSIAFTNTHGCCLRAVQAAAACHRGALPVQCAPPERSTATGGFHRDAVEYPERSPQVR